MRIWDYLIGRPQASDEEEQHKVGVIEGIPMLGLDALGSSSYGPEAALTLLIPLGALGLIYIGPIIGIILGLLAILFFSYRQTIAAYPGGGGSYTVAKENLGVRVGLLAAAALLLDYILNVAVGISAGVGALVSAAPRLHPHILALCLSILAVLTLINLRGTRESGLALSLPTYLFVLSLGGIIVLGTLKVVQSGGHPRPVFPPHHAMAATAGVSLWLLIRAFASGCTAMTGVEAVSNGVTAFAQPAQARAQRTLACIVLILGLLLGGIALLTRAYGITATDPERPGYESVVSQLVAAVVGRGWVYYLTITSVLAVLALSANTSFADFPRLCRIIAEDDFLPHAFATRGRRLVYTIGITILASLAALLLIVFGGITDRLIPLFAVGAFLAFTLSQAGMVVHWKRAGGNRLSLVVNFAGAIATGGALVVILLAKFTDGAWITALLIGALLYLFYRVNRHYRHIQEETEAPHEIDVTDVAPPVVVVPFVGWNTVSEKAIRFALHLSNEIVALHVSSGETDEEEMREQWRRHVETPLRRARKPVPALETVHSPYRQLVTPVLRWVHDFLRLHPDRQVAVLIPELVEPRWYFYLLHNQAASVLKAMLYLQGDRRVVVINVPWYLRREDEYTPGADISKQKRESIRRRPRRRAGSRRTKSPADR